MIEKLSEFISKIHAPYTHSRISYERAVEYALKLEDFDVIKTATDGELSALFLGKWHHTAIYLNGKVHEFGTGGYRCVDPVYFIYSKSRIEIRRLKKKGSIVKALKFIEFCKALLYDYGFKNKNGKYYCHEYVANFIIYVTGIKIKQVKSIYTLFTSRYLPESFDSDDFYKVEI